MKGYKKVIYVQLFPIDHILKRPVLSDNIRL